MKTWKKSGFDDFSKGTFGNGGQNLYVSANGILQRIFHFDVNGDGYPDIPVTNSHSMNEKPPLYVFDRADQAEPLKLSTNGSFDALFVDLYNRGVEDLVVACQHNGVHSDVSAVIYFGSEIGLSEKYKTELRVPNSIGVAAGKFDGSGKIALAFICDKKMRIFYQTANGIEASVYTELDIGAISVASGDLDGDGFDDLYVIRQGTGDVAVYWGGEDGINPERVTVFGRVGDSAEDNRATSTTAGRKMFRWLTWRCNVLNLKDKAVTFRVEDNYAVFESFGSDRQPHEEFRVACRKPEDVGHKYDAYFFGYGPNYATAGDLRNDGSKDIIIAVATDFENIDDAIILWEKENYAVDKAGKLPLRCPKTLYVGPFGADGKNRLLVGQSCRFNEFDVSAEVYRFREDGSFEKEATFPASEPTRVISGRTYTDGRCQVAVINHEGECKLGLEDVWIYLGDKDGYNTERRLAFPGHSAVDTFMVDFNDDGRPDVYLVNCAENAGYLCPGGTIYWNSEDGFDTEKGKTHLAGCSPHGAAIGDFRKCGYLDIVTGGIHGRDLVIYEGGPDGFTSRTIAMGPDWEKYVAEFGNLPRTYKINQDRIRSMTPEFKADYGGVRWLFAADFNGDGYLDALISKITGKRSFIYWGGPNGITQDNYTELATDGVSAATAADLNGNGYLDLVLSCHQSVKYSIPNERGKIVIYWGGPDGYQEFRKTELPTACANALTIQDFNGDGLLDIYATAYSNGRTRDIDSVMYFQSPDGMFHAQNFKNIFNHSGCGCMAGDFNGDGYIDLAVASHKAYGNHVCSSYIFWGGPDGINETRYTELPGRGPHGMCSMAIGNIMDRSESEYYYSEAYAVPENTTDVQASWKAENGPKTWVKMRIRSADQESELENAPWSEEIPNGGMLTNYELKAYVQYSLELGATCGCGTPRVSEITVDFL